MNYNFLCDQLESLGFIKHTESVRSTHYQIPSTNFGIILFRHIGAASIDKVRKIIFVEKPSSSVKIISHEFLVWFDIIPEDFKEKIIFNLDLFR